MIIGALPGGKVHSHDMRSTHVGAADRCGAKKELFLIFAATHASNACRVNHPVIIFCYW